MKYGILRASLPLPNGASVFVEQLVCTSHSYLQTALTCQSIKIISGLCQAKLCLVISLSKHFNYIQRLDVTLEKMFSAIVSGHIPLSYTGHILGSIKFFLQPLIINQNLSLQMCSICSKNCKIALRKVKYNVIEHLDQNYMQL